MALNSELLRTRLLALSLTEKPQSGVAAAQAWVDLYSNYAQLGMAGGAFPLIAPGPGKAAALAPLVAAFLMPVGVPAVVAAALGGLVTAYWTGATFATPPPGIALPPVGLVAFIPAATALLSNKDNSADAFASQLATLLDTCTRTVIVTVPAPTPYTLPVT